MTEERTPEIEEEPADEAAEDDAASDDEEDAPEVKTDQPEE